MTRYLLDTNIISNVIKPQPSDSLLRWFETQTDDDLFISSLTLPEIQLGILAKPPGRKRATLEAWFTGPERPQTLFVGRILAFDEPAALIWARLIADGKAAGRLRSPLDMIVASVAIANDCTLVTDNGLDFDGLEFINPLRETP